MAFPSIALVALLCLPSGWANSGQSSELQEETSRFDHDHGLLTGVLDRIVHGDEVDYRMLSEAPGDLRDYLGLLEAVRADEYRAWSKDQKYAFWINAYNAYTLDLVQRSYPVKSIKDLGGLIRSVWKKSFIPLGHLAGKPGKELSLDHLEHSILRPEFEDARVHAAINCASISCPPLRDEAYRAAGLDQQLDSQVAAWLLDPERNSLDEEGTLRVSRIFDWFAGDFEREAGSVQAWITSHAPEGELEWLRTAGKLQVRYLDYDWRLNDHKR